MADKKTRKSGSGFLWFLGSSVFLVVVLYCVYWIWMAGEIKKGTLTWVDDQRALGNAVQYDDLEVKGFPYRFVLEATNPVIEDRSVMAAWSGEKLQLIAMSWNLGHIMIRSPGENAVRPLLDTDFPEVRFSLGSKATASMRFEEGYTRRVGLKIPDTTVQVGEDRSYRIQALDFGLRPLPSAKPNLQGALSFERLELANPIPDADFLGQTVENVVIWVEVEQFFDVIEGRMSQSAWQASNSKIHLRRGEVEFGPLQAAARASVSIDANNTPNGTVGVHLKNGDELKRALEEAGQLNQETEQAINTLSAMSANDNFATVVLRDRGVYFLNQKIADL